MDQLTIQKTMERFLFSEYKNWVSTVQWHDDYVEINIAKNTLRPAYYAYQIAFTLHFLFCVKYQMVHIHGLARHTLYFIENRYSYNFFLFDELRKQNRSYNIERHNCY